MNVFQDIRFVLSTYPHAIFTIEYTEEGGTPTPPVFWKTHIYLNSTWILKERRKKTGGLDAMNLWLCPPSISHSHLSPWHEATSFILSSALSIELGAGFPKRMNVWNLFHTSIHNQQICPSSPHNEVQELRLQTWRKKMDTTSHGLWSHKYLIRKAVKPRP